MTILSISRLPAAVRRRGTFVVLSAFVCSAVVALLPVSSAVAATPAILLGTAEPFAILAGSGITNTGATSVAGDIGTFETTSETGFDSITLDGVNHVGDAVTQQARTTSPRPTTRPPPASRPPPSPPSSAARP